MMGMMPIMGSPLTFQASDVRALTGLSTSQLREWTSRRGILPADQPARGRGRHAHYAWNTVLVLRILAELHRNYRVEIAAWAETAQRVRDGLARTSPLSLHGKYLQISNGTYEIVGLPSALPTSICTIIPLDPHLEVLATGLGVPMPPAQLSLFAAVRT
jgi:hypothetical protein